MLNTFFSFKRYTIKKVKRQPAEWVKILPNHRSAKNTQNIYLQYEKNSYSSIIARF